MRHGILVIFALLMAGQPACAHQTFLAERYRRQHATLPDVAVKHDRLRAKLLGGNHTLGALEGRHATIRNHTSEPNRVEMVDGIIRIMQHILDPFYDLLKSISDAAAQDSQPSARGKGPTRIPNLLY